MESAWTRLPHTHWVPVSRFALSIAVVLSVLTLSAAPGAAQARVDTKPPEPVGFTLDRSGVTTGAVVTGVVSVVAESEDRQVRVERSMPEGWVAVATAVLPADATEVRMTMPTAYYSTYSYRVSTVSKQTVVTSPEQTLSVGPAYVPAGQTGDWSTYGSGHRWDPCAGYIRYIVNSAQAWPRALAETREALRRISQATGLRFLQVGTTQMVPKGSRSQTLTHDADLVIAWLRPGQTPLLKGGYLGQARYFTDADNRITHAQVAINKFAYTDLKPGFGAAPRRGTLLMHELTHAVGLGHADRKTQVMYPNVSAVPSKFGAGDLAGLATVGAQQGCGFTAG